MEDFLRPENEKKKFNAGIWIGVVVAVAVLGVAAYFLSMRPSIDDQKTQLMEGAITESSPEFAALSRNIIIARSDDTVQSPTGLGTISMYIKGTIYNKGTKNITLLEVNVAVVDQMQQVVKERRILVVPEQKMSLPAGENIPITLTMGGFDKNSDRADIRWKVTAIKVE